MNHKKHKKDSIIQIEKWYNFICICLHIYINVILKIMFKSSFRINRKKNNKKNG